MNQPTNQLVTNSACPTERELLAYYHACAPHSAHATIESHLEHCQTCLLRLDAQDQKSDTIVQALSTMPDVREDEPQFRALRSHLLGPTVSLTGDIDGQDTSGELELPTRVGTYELFEFIGSGATGKVYKARHQKLDRVVAVKIIDPISVRDPRSMLRFLDEMKAVGRLDHPHVIRATDAGEEDGLHFLVMEYAPGLDLSTLISRHGPLAIADACEIIRQASLGIDFAHSQGIIHRDVKPSNLLLCSNGQVKLLDLGLAVIQDDSYPTRSGENTALGTADYMSPEQWLDASSVESPTDLYGLGCTLFKLLTGHAPYSRSAKTVVAKREAHLHQTLPSVRSQRADVPLPLQRIIERLMAKEASARGPSAKQLGETLGQLVAGANLSKLASEFNQDKQTAPSWPAYVSPVASPASTAWRPVHRRFVITGLAGSAALFLLSGWLGRQTKRPTLDDRWRSLSPTKMSAFVPLDPLAVVDHDKRVKTITVSATDEMLVELGSPIRASFDITTTLCQEQWEHPSGVFFKCHSHASLAGVTHLFECILLTLDPDSVSHRLVWKSCRYHIDDGRVDRADQLLGQTNVPLRSGADRNALQVSVGRTRFPEVAWNGVKLPESRWDLSWEARQTREAIPRRQEIEYLGHLGVMVKSGTTTFEKTALRYVDV